MLAFANGEKVRGLNNAMEAAGLCSLYESQFGQLPAKYRHFLEVTPEKVRQRFNRIDAAR